MSRDDAAALQQATIKHWQDLCVLSKANLHAMGDYTALIDAIINLPSKFPSVFDPAYSGKAKLNATQFMTAIDSMAHSIHDIESLHPSYRDYFTENSTLWKAGLNSYCFRLLGSNQARIEALPYQKFICDNDQEWHPAIEDNAGFAYALLRAFMSYFLAAGNLSAFSEVKAGRYDLPKQAAVKILLARMKDKSSMQLACEAINGCHLSCQNFFAAKVVLAAIEAKPEAVSAASEDAGATEEKPALIDASDSGGAAAASARSPSPIAVPGTPTSTRAVPSPRATSVGWAASPTIFASPVVTPAENRARIRQARQLLDKIEDYVTNKQHGWSYVLCGYTKNVRNSQSQAFQSVKDMIINEHLQDDIGFILIDFITTTAPDFKGHIWQEFYDYLMEIVEALTSPDIDLKVSHFRHALQNRDAAASVAAASSPSAS